MWNQPRHFQLFLFFRRSSNSSKVRRFRMVLKLITVYIQSTLFQSCKAFHFYFLNYSMLTNFGLISKRYPMFDYIKLTLIFASFAATSYQQQQRVSYNKWPFWLPPYYDGMRQPHQNDLYRILLISPHSMTKQIHNNPIFTSDFAEDYSYKKPYPPLVS